MESRDSVFLSQLVTVMRALLEAGWPAGIPGLLRATVRRGGVRAAAFLTPTADGGLERQAWVHGPDWEASPPNHSLGTARAALARRETIVDPEERTCHVPLLEQGEPAGVISYYGVDPGVPVLFLEGVAQVAGVVLAGQRAFERQAALSATDGLTGLYNHRQFQQLLGVALGRAYLQGHPLHLILFDIDHFKQVNDTYGHPFGDLVLREVAYTARRVLPPDAIVARYGGEEFAVILPEVNNAEAPLWAERLREAVAAVRTVDEATGNAVGVTISLGVATYQLGQGKSRLLARADEALYGSKAGGRNRVTVAPPDPRSDPAHGAATG